MWLMKPSNQNQGRGIEICKNLREIKQCLIGKPPHSEWIVQKYIEKPLLYKNRKFDLRVWALVTEKLDIFFYKEGYMRTSSNDFDLDSNFNFVHLTNNCLQQLGNEYGKHEEGNTLSFSVLQDYFQDNFKKEEVSMEKHIIPRIKDLILDTIFSIKGDIALKKGINYELLGYDFMIDEDFRVWLIEVNTNPYLGIPNGFIGKLLPKMLDDLFDIALTPLYSNNKKLRDNGFDLIFCEKGSLFSDIPVNIRRCYSKKLIYPIKMYEQKIGTNRLPKEIPPESPTLPISTTKSREKKEISLVRLKIKKSKKHLVKKMSQSIQQVNIEEGSISPKEKKTKKFTHCHNRRNANSLSKAPRRTYAELMQEYIKLNDMQEISKLSKKLAISIIQSSQQDNIHIDADQIDVIII